MPCYLISYDLRKQGQDYSGLHNAIRAYGTWAKINESFWAVVTEQSAVEIRRSLSDHLDENDRLMVIKSGTEAAWKNAIAKNEWLKKYL